MSSLLISGSGAPQLRLSFCIDGAQENAPSICSEGSQTHSEVRVAAAVPLRAPGTGWAGRCSTDKVFTLHHASAVAAIVLALSFIATGQLPGTGEEWIVFTSCSNSSNDTVTVEPCGFQSVTVRRCSSMDRTA